MANETENQIVVYQPDGVMRIEVRFDGETVWLPQSQIAELFSCSLENVRLHLKNIYASGELEKTATSKESLEVRKEGLRNVTRKFFYYNLDAIISVGYRVNSLRATQFRRWATNVLKTFTIQGYVLDKERMKNGSFIDKDYFEKLLEEISFQNNPKLMDHIGDLVSYKNYVFRPGEDDIVEDNLGYPFEKFGNTEYRWKFPWCSDDNLQMYENIPGKTFSEHIANMYDNGKHVTFIAKNSTGLKNMFRIVSFANTNFIQRNARIPRKLIEENREGLLVGSACLNGEIFYMAQTRCDEDIIEAMKFYDYIEVQPPSIYACSIHKDKFNDVDYTFGRSNETKKANKSPKLPF